MENYKNSITDIKKKKRSTENCPIESKKKHSITSIILHQQDILISPEISFTFVFKTEINFCLHGNPKIITLKQHHEILRYRMLDNRSARRYKTALRLDDCLQNQIKHINKFPKCNCGNPLPQNPTVIIHSYLGNEWKDFPTAVSKMKSSILVSTDTLVFQETLQIKPTVTLFSETLSPEMQKVKLASLSGETRRCFLVEPMFWYDD